jgi:formylmethanofuran dehydrogenase subunit E
MTRREQRRKEKVEKLYLRIKEANLELEKIRLRCKHRHIERVNYQWRVGQITEGQVICSICGEVITGEPLIEFTVSEA